MNLLLDTHAFLWFVWADSKLSALRSVIEDPSNVKFLSIASCWEIAIKTGLGKLKVGEPANSFVSREVLTNSFSLLPISLTHATSIETLPFHHRDPFDRLLITQSLTDSMTLVSCDQIFDAYGVSRAW